MIRLRAVFAFLLPVLALTWLSGCEIINPDEDIPAYLQINKITVDPRKNANETFGTPSNNIVDAWVFVNGKLLGAFELPATIPVLASGPAEIRILAGIYSDGLSNSRFPYRFYNQYELNTTLTPGEVKLVEPVVTFISNLKQPYDLYEEFTTFAGTGSLQVPTNNPHQLVVNRDTLTNFAFANGAVGVVAAKAGEPEIIAIESSFNGVLPANGSPVFLEFDYRSNVGFQVGVIASAGGLQENVPQVGVFASTDWKKLYVNLTPVINDPVYRGASFRIYFRQTSTRRPGDYLALDNVRILSLAN